MNNKLFEFNQAAPNRYIAYFYRECTVAEFLKIIGAKKIRYGRHKEKNPIWTDHSFFIAAYNNVLYKPETR